MINLDSGLVVVLLITATMILLGTLLYNVDRAKWENVKDQLYHYYFSFEAGILLFLDIEYPANSGQMGKTIKHKPHSEITFLLVFQVSALSSKTWKEKRLSVKKLNNLFEININHKHCILQYYIIILHKIAHATWISVIITVLNNKINVLGADQDLIRVTLQGLNFTSYFDTLLTTEVSFF